MTYYKEYLTEWAKVKNDDHQIIETKELIQSQIIDLLKIITVSYATFEEQVFLSNLNWNFNSLEDPNEKLKAKMRFTQHYLSLFPELKILPLL